VPATNVFGTVTPLAITTVPMATSTAAAETRIVRLCAFIVVSG